MDHWSKMHVLFPLARKSAAEVALNLQNNVFALFGTPRILHSDNGRPRNPKCQGLVEQGNFMVEKLLGSRLNEYEGNDYPPWTEWLIFIQCKCL